MIPKSWIEKHGPSWRVRMREGNKKITVRSGLSRREAGRIKKETDIKLREGRNIVMSDITVEQLIDKINQLLRPQESDEYCDLIIRSLKRMAEHTGPRLSQIDLEGIDAMKADILDEGSVEATVNKYLRHCAAGCAKAVEWDMLMDNPFDQVSQMTEPEKDIRIVTREEEQQLLTCCRTNRDRCIIYLGIDGGLRAKEIAHLKIKDDFDPDTGRIHIINRDGVTTKSKKLRTVFIFDENRLDELVTLARSRKGYGPFPFFDRVPRSVTQRMGRIRTYAGVDCTLHDLRRTCATRMLLNGVPVPIVAKWMGHTIKVMQEFYTRVQTDDLMMVRDLMYSVQGNKRILLNIDQKDALNTQTVSAEDMV